MICRNNILDIKFLILIIEANYRIWKVVTQLLLYIVQRMVSVRIYMIIFNLMDNI